MIFYNIYNTKVEKMSQIIKDSSYVKIYPFIPIRRNRLEKVKAKLLLEFNKMNNFEEINKAIGDGFYRTSLYVRILLFRILYKALRLEINKENNEIFKYYFHKDFELSDFKTIENRLEKMVMLYENTEPDNTDNDELKKYDFDKMIANLEIILDIDLSGKFVYSIKIYEEKAMELITKNKAEDGIK